jgi:pyruvate/2-oxoglutarate dehydrogenase complex dihydrolipoamide acyltransferase (E2) component
LDERWLADARDVAGHPGGLVQRTVDMTAAGAWLDAPGIRGNASPLLVRAAALALARNPTLHETVCGYTTFAPGTVDIGLSTPNEGAQLPVVIRGADDKPLPALLAAMDEALAAARDEQRRADARFRRLAWLAPFAFMRRFLLRRLHDRFSFRRRHAGTFQITFSPNADVVVPMRFYTGSVLGAGRVREAVVAGDGGLEVRRVMSLSLVVDHVAMDGVRAATLLNGITSILESGELGREAEAVRGDA